MKIVMQGVASYPKDHPVEVNVTKKVALFYGQNGSGKSTIASFLNDPSSPRYEKCSVHFGARTGDVDYFVYNQDFVDKVFYLSHSQPGVFTLSKDNKEAQEAIDASNEKLEALREKLDDIDGRSRSVEEERKAEEKAVNDAVWSVKEKYAGGVLDFCLKKYKSDKNKFREKVQASSLPDEGDSIDLLVEEAEEIRLQGGEVKQEFGLLSFPESELERSPLLEEKILPSSDSYLSELISNLGNSDWVSQGLPYLNSSHPQCPFCQQTVDDDLFNKISAVFDKTYDTKIINIQSLRDRYDRGAQRVVGLLENSSVYKELVEKEPRFQDFSQELKLSIYNNLKSIDEKLEHPSEAVQLLCTSEFVDKINKTIESANDRVRDLNKKVLNKKNTENYLRERFWKLAKKSVAPYIEKYKNKCDELDRRKQDLRCDFAKFNGMVYEELQVVKENQDKVVNLQRSIDSINSHLSALGVTGFYVGEDVDNSKLYRLYRDDSQENVYRTLSEGEKTLITFLYFLEVCKGSTDKGSLGITKNRVVVVDDPISSLSHNHVYDIAVLVHRYLINSDFRNVLVFTHSLFFFHEMNNLRFRAEYDYFRISKLGVTRVYSLNPKEIMNEYQSFWKLVKDARDSGEANVSLPNAMRSILEYYFGFVHNMERLSHAFNDLSKDAEFKVLYRYVNRESHMDAMNIQDHGEIDGVRFVHQFYKIFEHTGHQDHYHKMMGDS